MFQEETKALAQAQKGITVQDRRKYELLLKSGQTGSNKLIFRLNYIKKKGINKPFRAPVYDGYREVIKALSK